MNIKQSARAAELLIDLAELLSTKETEILASELLENITGRSISLEEAVLIETQVYT